METQHFLRLSDFSAKRICELIDCAIDAKLGRKSLDRQPNKSLVMIFTKHSTRTRVSFEIAMTQLGGAAVFLSSSESQMARGEDLADTARVIASMADVVVMRCHAHEDIEKLAAFSEKPVINGLTNLFHPCQLLADLVTMKQMKGEIERQSVAWVGDGNNMCRSYIEASSLFGFPLSIACPPARMPDLSVFKQGEQASFSCPPHIKFCENAIDAVSGADIVSTDTWNSMGESDLSAAETKEFQTFQVNDKLMAHARKDAIFLHCLPAHKGQEVTASVIEGRQSAVWQQAENRLHAQKALLASLLGGLFRGELR